jgi:RNA-splicing ligase RtcB
VGSDALADSLGQKASLMAQSNLQLAPPPIATLRRLLSWMKQGEMVHSDSILNLAETGWIDEALSWQLRGIAKLSGRSGPVVCLPDVHLKRGMEAPSSLATAFTHDVVPDLSSCSLNCGMGAVKADIPGADLTPARVRDFYRLFRDSARSTDWDLTYDEVVEVVRRGFPAIASKYGFYELSAERIENGGCIGRPMEKTTVDDLLRGVHPARLKRWQTRLGLSIGGNHFVELQRVTRIHDAGLASRWRLAEGQVLVMYHGGGGPLAGFMGRFFGNRTKDRPRKRAHLFFRKLRYHFGELDSVRSLPSRLKYFSPRTFARQNADSAEGQRLVASIGAGMNYGYAYRLAIASRVARSLHESFGVDGTPNLVYDSSHNSIQRERIAGRSVWVHRHNSCRVDPEAPLILPGMYNSPSFLAVGAESADRFLRSAPHGLGELVSRDAHEGSALPLATHTLRFDGFTDDHTVIPHIQSPRMVAAIERMEAEGLLRRVVELTPIAVLKGFRA